MGNDLQTVLLLYSAFPCIFRFFGLTSSDTVTTLVQSLLASFLPSLSVVPAFFCKFAGKETDMNIEEARQYCLSLKNVTEGLPFGDDFLVFKVEEKMFALISLDGNEPRITLKCHPDFTGELRDHFSAVEPAWHFNKKYWNTIFLDRDMSREDICHWISHSYWEVIAKLPKKIKLLYPHESDE